MGNPAVRRGRQQWGWPGAILGVFLVVTVALLVSRHAVAAPRTPAVAPPEAIVPDLTVGPCSLIQSDFTAGEHRNFEALVLEGSNLVHYFKINEDLTKPWSRGPIVSPQATGPGCIIQSDFIAGDHGNFEAVVLEGKYLVHYFKVNDNVDNPWQRGATITSQATGPGCIIQSDFMAGGHGNFEVVVPEGSKLVHYFKVNDNIDNPWQRGQTISTQATGPGCIVQSDFMAGGHGNFEAVALEGSKLVHYFHINDDVNNLWQRGPEITTQATGPASLIQSDFLSAEHGALELVVPEQNRLAHYFFADLGDGRKWHPGQTITSAATGAATLYQGDFIAGDHGNFEVLVKVNDGVACRTAAPCIRHFYHINDDINAPWQGGYVAAYTGRSQKVCQMTGEDDREWGYKTVNQTQTFGVWGTDLGIVTEHAGSIYYFFGDVVSTRPPGEDDTDGDTYALSNDRTPEDCLQLNFFKDGDGWWRGLIIPGVSMEAFETPTGAFSANGKLYVFVMSAWNGDTKRHGLGVLARSLDNGATFSKVQDISFSRFINVAPIVAATPGTPTLPNEPGVWLFASGVYRQSPIYLAWLPFSAVDSNPRPALRFFAGLQNGRPTWSANETAAVALTDQACVGELSAVWNASLRRYLLLYNCDVPRGINLRAAAQPWGPWSDPGVILDPHADGVYCHFMHAGGEESCDRVSDANRANEYGGEYGPYVIPPLTVDGPGRTTLYYLLSTWNPYEAMLLRTTLRVPSFSIVDAPIFAGQLDALWQDWSWDTKMTWDQVDVTHNGAPALRVTFTQGNAGLSLRSAQPFTGKNYAGVGFWVYGGQGGTQVALSVQQTDDGQPGPAFPFTAPAGVWTYVAAPLAALGSPAQIARLTWQEATGAAQSAFYLDDIRLLGVETPPAAQSALYLPLLQRK